MSAGPLVSVCIPTYRGTAYLGAAIDSVLAQTYPNFELLIIDDHSGDGTSALVQRYTDERIRFIENSVNLGPEGNWNKCLAEARGTYVKLLPHDDLLMPRCLEKQVEALAADGGERVALVFSAREIIAPSGRPIATRGYPGGRPGTIPAAQVIRRCLRHGTNLIGEPGAVMFRRRLAFQVGRFDATHPYVIDLDYWFRLLLHGDAHYIPDRLAAFRLSASSWSTAIGRGQSADFCRFIDKVHGSSQYSIKEADIGFGRIMARANNVARLVLYRWALRRGRRSTVD